MKTKSIYECPVCFYHKQKYEAVSRAKLHAHLFWSHPQIDLVSYIIKTIPKERVRDYDT